LCYAEVEAINDYLHREDVLKLLGVRTPVPFTSCSSIVGNEFNFHFDKFAVPTQHYVSNLLDRGMRILIYAGTYDWQCNWVANKLWVDKLEWTGSTSYAQGTLRNWTVGNTTAGQTKSSGPLTFATVLAAGHMMSAHLVLLKSHRY
jgi:carboxypeptidase C (cathepsin A)